MDVIRDMQYTFRYVAYFPLYLHPDRTPVDFPATLVLLLSISTTFIILPFASRRHEGIIEEATRTDTWAASTF